MRTKMAAPLAAHDLESVARGFDAIGPQAPNGGWAGWAAAAKAGAEAARKNDLSATRAACQSCHSAHREAYRKDHRSRPPPP
jgi:hypothetical protein